MKHDAVISNVYMKGIKKAKDKAYLDFPISIATVGGTMPSEEGLKIIQSYSSGKIDYETAQLEIAKLYKR